MAKQEFSARGFYDWEGNGQTGTVTVVREDGSNMATLIVDDGIGNQAAVLMGWQQASLLMAYLGAVGVHM
jgi:hypothetical protein